MARIDSPESTRVLRLNKHSLKFVREIKDTKKIHSLVSGL